MQRSPALQTFLDKFTEQLGPSMAVVMVAADHPFECKCDTCLGYWIDGVGPEYELDGTLSFGPFSHDEIRAELLRRGEDPDARFAQWKADNPDNDDPEDDDPEGEPDFTERDEPEEGDSESDDPEDDPDDDWEDEEDN